MASYITGLAVAGLVVGGMLGLLSASQERSVADIDRQTAALDQSELLAAAQDVAAENRLESVLRLADEPGDLSKTIPVLAKLSLDSDELIRSATTIAFKNIGAKGGPHVRLMIESGEQDQITQACSALKELGGGELYFEQLRKWLGSSDVNDRKRALFVLQGVGPPAGELMDLIIEALDDPDFNNQCMACRVLESLGTDAMPAENALLRLAKEGNPSTRGWAAVALGAMGPTDQTDVARLLANNLEAFVQIEKQRALIGLAHMGPEASSVVDEVRNSMIEESRHVMPHAAYALFRITGKPDESLKVLGELIDDPSYMSESIELAGKMQSDAAPLVGKLIGKLRSEDESVRELAVVALGNIGPAAAKAKPEIEKLLFDNDALIRYAAKESLKQIAGEQE
jgi:HEAT repeat protein